MNIVPSLGIAENDNLLYNLDRFNDPLISIIQTYEDHPSIVSINENKPNKPLFLFNTLEENTLKTLIDTLDSSKSCQKNDVPIKIIKMNNDILSEVLSNNINECFRVSCFPDELKVAEVVPIFKKDSKSEKSNYRPVSILSNISKIYEHGIYNQLSFFFENVLSKYRFGFSKGFSAQECLVSFIELWKKSVDQNGAFGALLTDLSKAFDCVNHDLLVAKLYAYGVDFPSLKLIFSYLFFSFFFFNDTATTEIYTLSLHDALPILTINEIRSRVIDYSPALLHSETKIMISVAKSETTFWEIGRAHV